VTKAGFAQNRPHDFALRSGSLAVDDADRRESILARLFEISPDNFRDLPRLEWMQVQDIGHFQNNRLLEFFGNFFGEVLRRGAGSSRGESTGVSTGEFPLGDMESMGRSRSVIADIGNE